MGLIVTTSDGGKLYYSTNGQSINTVKMPKERTEILSADELNTAVQEFVYEIVGAFNVWENETDYIAKNHSNTVLTIMTKLKVDTLPVNSYTVLYDKLKQTLASGNVTVDDI